MASPSPQTSLSPTPSSSQATPSSSRPSLSAPSLHARSRSASPSSSDRLFTPFKEMISGGEGSRSLGVASAGLGALRDVLEAVDTLPFVKYLASVGVQLLQYVIEMQITNDMFKNLAMRAKDVIVAVARSCDGLQSLAFQLESDLRQLTSTMDSILAFAAEKASRGTLRKLWNKSEDVAMVKALDIQLTHSFNIFQIQSDVVTRRQQELMITQLANLTASPPLSPPRTEPGRDVDRPSSIKEGIYLIRNVASKKVLEIEDFKPFGHVLAVHAFMVPYSESPSQAQLWLIQKSANKDLEFTIHSLATGYALNIVYNSDREGAKVGGYPWEPGQGNGIWSFWGAGLGESSDYCTIRSTGLPTVLDGVCPRTTNAQCNDLHATRIADAGSSVSQQWRLIPVSFSPSPSSSLHATPNTVSPFPRRQLMLQNVQTGLFATRTETLEGPNVVLSTSSPTNSTWSFLYIDTIRRDRFAILSCVARPFTVDHWGGQYINLARYRPENPYHKWIAIPRDGAFLLKNNITDALLAARSGVVDTLSLSARDNPACHWRLIDATTNEHIRILYDSALSIVPPELAGPSRAPSQHLPVSTSPTLRTGDASPELGRALLNNFKREHATIRTMLEEGYQGIVYAPRVISGWRKGEVRSVRIEDDDSEFKWSSKKFEPCS
ncbi:unnamed protein product [Peniophora sp. CBMAI 1063]|nr:unnamed protein product [Peniophora sp. CBMAI 1063]